MKILTKYLLKSLLFPLFYCLIGFCLIFIISDMLENFNEFYENNISLLGIVKYYSLFLPPNLVHLMPVCLLLSMLYSLSNLTRHSEITAMRAGGVSIFRIVMPFISVGLCATLFIAYINETIAPDSGYHAEKFLDYHKSGRDDEVFFARNLALKNRNNIWNIQRFDTRDYSMYNVEMIEQREDGSGTVKYQAEKALWLDGRWWFTDLTTQAYKENGDKFGPAEMILQKEMRDLRETPQTFIGEIKVGGGVKDLQNLSAREIRRYLRSKKNISEEIRTRMLVDMHSRLAAPFTCLIVTLIGIPVGAHTGRRGAFAGIMAAMFLFFAFYILQLSAQALGKNEVISPLLGGWLTVIVFGAISPLFILRLR
ncbi:MAG: LptF/LptG family permease [Pontiellaceae bacterium]|jgi:lipopolysaccharide export system permease protein|nr:LptF/LptG family permease [Pontiellaceae bacterium]